MPDLRIADADGQLDEWSFIRLFAAMLHPDAPDKAEELMAVGEIQHPYLPTTDKPPIYRALEPGFYNLVKKGKLGHRGHLAADVLIALMQIFDHPAKIRGRDPSLDQAFALVAARRHQSASIVQKSWNQYRTVSHLWASLLALIASGDEEFDYGPVLAQEICLGGEDFLEFAATHKTGLGKLAKPILTQQEAWCLPVHVSLGQPFEKVRTPPLSESDLKTLERYAARKRCT